MSSMNRAIPGRGSSSASKAIEGLPRVNYYPPLVVTLAATGLVFAVVLALTLIALGNAAAQWDKAGNGTEGGAAAGILICGSVFVVGAFGSVYFLIAIIKGVRDLFTPLQYTRGELADKRVVGGRVVGNWIGLAPSYVGPDVDVASAVTDEQAVASADRAQIVQTRNAPAPRLPDRKRGSYLSPDRISSSLVTDARSTGVPGMRAVFRVDQAAYDVMSPGEEVLVAHSRFIEHIYYVAHLRDGKWESFRNKALI